MTKIFATPAALLGSEGTQLGPTGWLAIDQARVDGFAGVTGDHQWIHVDVARARQGPFGGTIAHGYLTMSLINHFLPELIEVRGFAHAVNVGLDRLRFLAPVLVGARIRAVSEIVSAEAVKGAIQAIVRITIEIEGPDGQPQPRPALVADAISRYFPEGG
ncbi:MAG TPA: MaoC family dehydratase [Novosphingobium sp.]|nr:MaoC family dehydratase [Novosphingobium sp.]